MAAYLEIADGPVPIQVELDRTLLETGSIYYSRTTDRPLVKMVLISPAGPRIEEVVRFEGPPPPPDAAATGERSSPEWSPAAPLETEISVPAALAGIPDPPRAPHKEAARPQRDETARAVPAPRRLSLLAHGSTPPQRANVEAPPLLVQADGLLPPLPGWSAPQPPSVPERAPRPANPAKVAAAGQIIWTGRLERRGVVEIQDQQPSVGHLAGGLPGAPVAIQVLPGELVDSGLRLYTANAQMANRRESPGPQNGWNATEYVWDPARARDITVLEPPDGQNGWKHLVLRAESRSYSVIVVRWFVRQAAN